jgi:hypothetical protein
MIARLPGFKSAIGILTEEFRVQSDPQEIEAYLELLESPVIDLRTDMVVNRDEAGHCDWIDARTEPEIVPEEFSDGGNPVAAQFKSKGPTLLGAITAVGGQLESLAIVHHDAIETEL